MWRLSKPMAYISIVLIVVVLSSTLGMSAAQITSLVVFSGIIAGVLFYWRMRLAFALAGLSILLVTGVMDLLHFIEFASLDIIVFLIGMMIVIGFLEERRFFEALLERIMSFAKGSAVKTVSLLMLMSALSAALVDEVTSILFMMTTAIHLVARLNLSIVPLMMMLVFATNIGSSATVVGNPVGVMIAMKAKLTFADFLRWATPIAIVGLSICMILSFAYFRGYIKSMKEAMVNAKQQTVGQQESTKTKFDIVSIILFVGTLTGLILHSQIEHYLKLEKNTMLIGVAVISAAIALLCMREKARDLVERRVDWWTLTFFLVFFSSVGTLKYTGVTTQISKILLELTGGDQLLMLFLFSLVVGLLSALMDNVLAVATFIPIVAEIGGAGLNIFPIWWGMLFGATWMGNLTMIGSTANIVAVGMVERQKLGHVSFREWIVPGTIVSLITFPVALLLLYIQLPFMSS
ncbi:MAG: SLC13 family permease [Nitrososphaerota archaeon]|nr:SLC13 family permease [Aigarchaeota archaeon]MDW8076169.1 SLC13 family permease [Nitrososphaerota archaeon]